MKRFEIPLFPFYFGVGVISGYIGFKFSEVNLRYFSFSFSRYLRILGSIFGDFLVSKFMDLFVLK